MTKELVKKRRNNFDILKIVSLFDYFNENETFKLLDYDFYNIIIIG